MERTGITCAGNWIIDHVKTIDLWPEEGNLANILSEKPGTGGAPYNVLMGLAKFQTGIPLHGIGMVGDDADGHYILSHGESNGINMEGVVSTWHERTSHTDVMTVKGSGQRTFFHNRGANKLLSEKHIHLEVLPSKIFHLGYLLILDQLDLPDEEFGTKAAKVFHRAQELGIKTSLDLVSEMSDRFTKIVPPTLPYIDYLILNELEAGRTTGHVIRKGDTLDKDSLAKSARTLIRMGVKDLVVIHFPEGGYALTRDGEEKIQYSLSLPNDYIQGTAGAGDAFCAGMLYALHQNWPLEKSLQLSVCAAAACLSDATCTDGMMELNATLELLNKYPPEV
jgi:sugar/nucleoside kinase (ribokinase family)